MKLVRTQYGGKRSLDMSQLVAVLLAEVGVDCHQGCWIWGIVDQLEFGEDGRVVIVEQKTRFQPSLPSHSQRRTTALQVMLYRCCITFGI